MLLGWYGGSFLGFFYYDYQRLLRTVCVGVRFGRGFGGLELPKDLFGLSSGFIISSL